MIAVFSTRHIESAGYFFLAQIQNQGKLPDREAKYDTDKRGDKGYRYPNNLGIF